MNGAGCHKGPPGDGADTLMCTLRIRGKPTGQCEGTRGRTAADRQVEGGTELRANSRAGHGAATTIGHHTFSMDEHA